MTDEQEAALVEFRRCAWKVIHCPKSATIKHLHGLRYALEMAKAELGLLGLDPEKVTPDGYDGQQPGRRS